MKLDQFDEIILKLELHISTVKDMKELTDQQWTHFIPNEYDQIIPEIVDFLSKIK